MPPLGLTTALGVLGATLLAVLAVCVWRDHGLKGDAAGLVAALGGGLVVLLLRSPAEGTSTPWVVVGAAWVNASILMGSGLSPMRLMRREKRADNTGVRVAALAVPVLLVIVVLAS